MHYRVYLDDQQEWRWAFRTSTYKTIAVSKRGYPHKRECLLSILLVKNWTNAPIYEGEECLPQEGGSC